MALRRAAGALVPKLFQSQQAVIPACNGLAHLQSMTAEQPTISTFPEYLNRAGWRTFASEITKSTPSTLTPTDRLSVSPTNKISYDEHSHVRFPPSSDNKSFAYLVLTGGRFVYASAIRLAVLKFVVSLSAAADTLALASMEVDISNLQEGETVTVKWRGKPVFIRHRTAEEIEAANEVNLAELRDPQTDAERATDPKYLIVVGICTHLGCVPIGGAGDYNGWFCPCHGSHYDISGRIRKGPAPYNLEVPEYKFLEEGKILVG